MKHQWQIASLVLMACGTADPAREAERARGGAESAPVEAEPTEAPPDPSSPPAAAPPDGLYAATFRAEAATDACRVVNGSHHRAYAIVGAHLEPSVEGVSSTNNENTEYALVAPVAAGACDSVVLVLAGQVRAPSSSLGDRTGCDVTFSLDRADAD